MPMMKKVVRGALDYDMEDFIRHGFGVVAYPLDLIYIFRSSLEKE